MQPAVLDEKDCRTAIELLGGEFDPDNGGFGRAPKFPPSMLIEALLRDGGETAMGMATRTLQKMARGGIYDQLAGGFARYSVDARWVVPHFEKMLYDNALLLGVLHPLVAAHGDPLARRVVEQTVEWLTAEMRTAQGAYASSLDADSARRARAAARGRLLRLDPRSTRAGARRRRRGLGGGGLRRHRGRNVRRRCLDAATPRRSRPRAAPTVRDRLRGRPGRAIPARSRRQGGRRLERLADRLPGRGGAGHGPSRTGWRPRPRRPSTCGRSTGGTGACAAPRATGGRATRRASWRTTARWPRPTSDWPRRRPTRCGWSGPRRWWRSW